MSYLFEEKPTKKVVESMGSMEDIEPWVDPGNGKLFGMAVEERAPIDSRALLAVQTAGVEHIMDKLKWYKGLGELLRVSRESTMPGARGMTSDIFASIEHKYNFITNKLGYTGESIHIEIDDTNASDRHYAAHTTSEAIKSATNAIRMELHDAVAGLSNEYVDDTHDKTIELLNKYLG